MGEASPASGGGNSPARAEDPPATVTPAARPRRRTHLTASELRAWRAFLHAHAHVTRKLEADLLADQELSLSTYDVLVQLAEAPHRQLRMTELAERVLLSRSGLTRLVDRLEGEGYVTRVVCAEDARGLFCVLTPTGLERLRQASGTHLRGVADHVVSRYTAEELVQLETLMNRMLENP